MAASMASFSAWAATISSEIVDENIEGSLNPPILTVFFQSPETFELLDDGGEGVGDDGGHDEYCEDQY